jgi:hypothetical protein
VVVVGDRVVQLNPVGPAAEFKDPGEETQDVVLTVVVADDGASPRDVIGDGLVEEFSQCVHVARGKGVKSPADELFVRVRHRNSHTGRAARAVAPLYRHWGPV